MESKTLKVKGKSYVLVPRDLEIMSLNEITMQGLRTRLLNGWNFRDAIDAPSGMRREEMLAKHRVRTRYFEELEKNNLIVKIKADSYGRLQRG
ncbi:hypothetical protein BUZ63_00305 [Staphylococcus pasteuri]|uniref:SA1788 family PVL leukocidin-associated protein n=1 Tax=Staphylococcus pasteuri TaxID=45972 RepID=UPI000E67D21C|nr:SA1788 family PVL leukocidin-associated protein [Staphylococcus pasteuri]RIO41902.1 hypothetical protein BUZ63_00305 [Staphylococcus pasteuri]